MRILKKITLAVFLMVSSLGIVACTKPASNYSLNLEANKEIACPGEVVNFTTEVIGDDVDIEIEYQIIAGDEYATITNEGVLTVNDNAVAKEKIKVVSKSPEKTSNEVVITVGTKLTAIQASSNKTEIIAGTNATLNATLLPEDANAEAVKWEVVEGSEACSIVSNLLIVNEDAEKGTTIKVKAVSGTVESNELTFTVISGTSDKLFLSLSNSSLVIDKNSTALVVLQSTIFDAEYNVVNDKIVDYEVIEGSEYLAVNTENNVCTFEALGHGTAVVQATIRGTNYTATAEIEVLVPPTALKLHDVFTERVGYEYNFSKVDTLKFPVEVIGQNVCDEFTVSFKDELNNTGDEVAIYNQETGEITFNKTGEITVTVESNSGSKNEVSISYTFDVNEGINVYTFDELKAVLESSDYNGEIVNVVVLEKPTTEAYNYEYGYDLVPSFALKAQADQTFGSITSEALGTIRVYNKNVHIKGNNHKIDLSQVRTFTSAEQSSLGWSQNQINPALFISSSKSGLQIDVKLYDLTIVGNCTIDYAGDINGKTAVGVYSRGIQIGTEEYNSAYYLDMQNVTIGQFYTGMRIYHVVNNGIAKNINVYNCFANGIESYANIMTFEDMTYGLCGGAGIELTPNADVEAGLTFDQPQSITFAGSISTTNLSSGNSKYMQNFNAAGMSVIQILQAVFSQYSTDVLSNVRNEKGEFAFISFIFNDLSTFEINESTYDYKNIDGAGIININELSGVDTEHKYIEVDVIVSGISVGTVLVYNFNYVGE